MTRSNPIIKNFKYLYLVLGAFLMVLIPQTSHADWKTTYFDPAVVIANTKINALGATHHDHTWVVESGHHDSKDWLAGINQMLEHGHYSHANKVTIAGAALPVFFVVSLHVTEANEKEWHNDYLQAFSKNLARLGII